MFAWIRLADAAAGGLIVLAAGSLAALFCRQPVRRARLIVLTLLGGVAVPCLGALPIAPRWSARLLPVPAALRPRPRPDAETTDIKAVGNHLSPSLAARASAGRERAGRTGATPWVDARPGRAVASSRPVVPVSAGRWAAPAARTVLYACYVAVAAGFAAWWLVGQAVLWRMTRAARPASGAVRDLFAGLAGSGGERVVLLESDRIARPFTYTWARPVILLPAPLCDGDDRAALRYVLAHEWSHVERHDSWAWNFASLAGLVLFYQPLFWWLRRQLRLCQDYLADARAADAGSPEDYAAFLVRLARACSAGPALPALGIGDRRSNLSRRVMMLLQDREPLERRCRFAWSLAAASVAAAVIVAASGLRLRAAAPPAEPAKATAPKPPGETLSYTGTVVDKDTGRPIAGAVVTVRRSVMKSGENRILQETRHTTGDRGTYSFEIPPDQVAEPRLYIELDVEHPDYATRAGFGYALGMTRKNETLNERPFFETLEMRPARPITARVEMPEGQPAAGVEVLAYSRTDKLLKNHFEYGSFARARTDADGRFRLPITTPGRGVFWVLPKAYAPEMHVLPEGKRGDLGTITLKEGVTVTGRLFDAQGKPLAGVYVEADRDRNSGPDSEALNQLMVSDSIHRVAETDAGGRFTFDPLPPGSYRVMPTEFNYSHDHSVSRIPRDVPGVFIPTKLTIAEGEPPAPLEVRASPLVVIEGRWLDSQGRPKSGWSSSVFGRIDGSSWFGMTRPDDQGRFSLNVPHGLEEAQFDISTNEHASALHRVGKDAPLTQGRHLRLGTLDHDVKGIEIVRYVAPILVVNATTRDGRQIEGFKATVKYTRPDAEADGDFDKDVHVVGGAGRREAIQDEQYDGRYRTSQMLPDREVEVTVSADGFAPASRKLSLPEGKIEELNFVLEAK
jgi:beta-lactamase regulating signal transducer with metallopeptidase domain